MWTDEKLKLLFELYSVTDNSIISEKLKIKVGTLINKANGLGLKKTEQYISNMRKKNNPQTYWSDADVDKLVEFYKTHSNKELSIIVNKTAKGVSRKLKRLKLKRSKKEKNFITGKICKLNGRDLTFDLVKSIAIKYNTRHEFYLMDCSAYNKAQKNKWLSDICGHMVCGNLSIPQLILKDILEFILNKKCSYNNRSIIKPLEIDCYFPKWKIGWEYDGRYYHTPIDYEYKKEMCLKVGVALFNIHEFTDDYRDYEINIKTQLIDQIDDIISITNININKEDILNYTPKINYPNLLTLDEKGEVKNKKMSEIKSNEDLFKKIKKYKIFEDEKLNITNDLPKYNHFKNFNEYKQHLIKSNYNTFTELCKYEHPYRLMKKWGLSMSLIHNMYK